MQLLYCSAIPTVEFASVSLLLRESPQSSSWSSGEVILLASPLTTCSLSQTNSDLNELHEYLNVVFKKLPLNKENASGNKKSEDGITVATSDQLLHDDASLVDDKAIQVFRPSKGHGIGLYYIVLREAEFVLRCFSVLLASETGGSFDSIEGVILCVGVSGLHYSQSSSNLIATIAQRLHDSANVMQKMGSFRDPEECRTATDALLASLTLTDNEDRRTNVMIDAESVTMTLDTEGDEGKSGKNSIGSVLKNSKQHKGTRVGGLKRGLSAGDALDLKMSMEFISSADMARMTVDRLAVLSVAEKDTSLRKYGATGQQRRTTMELGNKNRIRRRRKGLDEADLKEFDFFRSQEAKALATVPVSTSPSVSIVQSGKPLRGPNRDTMPRVPGQRASVPTLTAPKNDHAVSNRRTSLQQSAVSAKQGSEKIITANLETAASAAFDAFAVDSNNDQDQMKSFSSIQFPSFGSLQGQNDPNTWGIQQQMARTEVSSKRVDSSSFDPFVSEGVSAKESDVTLETVTTSSPGNGTLSKSSKLRSLLDVDDHGERPPSTRNKERQDGGDDVGVVAGFTKDDELMVDSMVLRRATEVKLNDSSNPQKPKIQVNIALNEDLTCSYRQSRISSCTIEGVVQVQVKSELTTGTPFFLLLKDPANHIRMIQENRRYADDMTEAFLTERKEEEKGFDHKFTISVPKAENYFPVMRYKCSNELRPVPIRVQTRTRMIGGLCRVALQISSNPANEDDLTDLTIIMGVPVEVKGETLTTQPTGGVWNAARRSVIWCVAELGDGEKFQLQAQFELDEPRMKNITDERPRFPVLVRCQCMYAQLSLIELEVADIPEVFPAEVTMKLARRFRLSHRERS